MKENAKTGEVIGKVITEIGETDRLLRVTLWAGEEVEEQMLDRLWQKMKREGSGGIREINDPELRLRGGTRGRKNVQDLRLHLDEKRGSHPEGKSAHLLLDAKKDSRLRRP